MQINSGILYRSIVGSNELTFLFNGQFENVTGESSIGFSKNFESDILFRFESGKILDHENNHVWSYNPGENISISGNLGPNFLNYFIQNTPVCLYSNFDPKYYNNFLIETKNSSVDFDLFIQGLQPSYSITFPSKIPIGKDVTGYITNLSNIQDQSFKVYSGDLYNAGGIFDVNNNIYPSLVDGLSSGNIILDFVFDTGNPTLAGSIVRPRLILKTNFGNITQDFEMQFNNEPIYYIEFLAGFTGLTFLNNQNTSGYFYNYELRSIIPKPEVVNFSVFPVLGNTGEKILDFYEATGLGSGVFSGFVHGFDYLSGTIKGQGVSDDFNFYGNRATGDFDSINQNKIFHATGHINYAYNLPFKGGFAIGFPPSGTKINALSINEANLFKNNFIFKERLVNFSGTVPLSGIFNDVVNTGVSIGYFQKNVFYTGSYIFNLDEKFWSPPKSGIPGIENINSYDKFILVENKYFSGFIYSGESGLATFNDQNFYSKSNTGVLLRHILLPSLTGANIEISASENSELAQDLFIEKDLRNISAPQFWFSSGSQSGFLRIEFKDTNNVSPIAKYYEFGTDFNSSFYPSDVSLLGSQDLESWTVLDNRTFSDSDLNNNWYSSNQKVFKISNPQSFKYLQFQVNQSKLWPHKDYDSGNNILLNINSLYFYENININLPENVQPFVPNLNSYSSNDGDVIFSKDYNPFVAWRAFTQNELSDMAVLSRNGSSEEIFLGYEKNQIFNNYLTGYYIEFLPNYVPKFLSIETKKPGQEFIEYYRKPSGVNVVEKGDIYLPSGVLSCRFSFEDVTPTSVSKFYPAMGDRDYDDVDGFGQTYLTYFNNILNNLIKNSSSSKKYYEVKIGPCHFFILDSDPITGGSSRCGLISEGAGKGESILSKHNESYRSLQKVWFNNAITNSKYPWKFVLFNHPPFTSEIYNYGYYDLNVENGWNLNLANIIFNGFSRNYERFQKRLLEERRDVHYIVNGGGGRGLRDFGVPMPDSVYRLKKYGWTKLDIYSEGLKVSFIDASNNSEFDVFMIGNVYGNLLYRYAIVGNFNYINRLSNDPAPPDFNNPLGNNFYTRQVFNSMQLFNPTCMFSVGNQGFF